MQIKKEELFKKLNESLNNTKTLTEKVSSVVTVLDECYENSSWANSLTRDEIIDMFSSKMSAKRVAVKICEMLNKNESKKSLKESYTKFIKSKKVEEAIEEHNEEEPEEVYSIKYWVDEDHRDQGISDIYFGEIKDLADAKRIADKLFDEYESVEVVKNLDSEDEEVVYGRYPEEESLTEDYGSGIARKLNDADIYFDVAEDEDGDDFYIFDGWQDVAEAQEVLAPDYVAEDNYDTEALDKLIRWGFRDSYERCYACGKLIETEPDSYSWKPDFFVDYENGEVICGNCVRENPNDYLNTLINNPKQANTILSRSDLEYEGFEELEDDYENGWYDRADDPEEILDDLLNRYYEGEFIFNLDANSQFATRFSVWGRNMEEYEDDEHEDEEEIEVEESLDEGKEVKYIYQFPEDMAEEDINKLKEYNLELLGKVSDRGFQPGDFIVKGKLKDLNRYCDEYLGYEMHRDYLYKEDEFDTEILESKEDKEYSVEIDLLKYSDEIEDEFELESLANEYNLYIDMSSIGENHKCYDVIGKKEDLKDFCNDVLGAKLEEFEVIEESLERNFNFESLTDSFNNFRNEHKNNLTESKTFTLVGKGFQDEEKDELLNELQKIQNISRADYARKNKKSLVITTISKEDKDEAEKDLYAVLRELKKKFGADNIAYKYEMEKYDYRRPKYNYEIIVDLKESLNESITERDIKRGNKFKDGAGNFYVIKNVDYDDRVHFDYVGKDGKVIFSNSLYMNSFLPKLQFNKSELVKESREESLKTITKQDAKKMADWWKEVSDIFYIDLKTVDDIEDEQNVEEWHAAMYDTLRDLAQREDEESQRLVTKGKKLYNKYAISKFNESLTERKQPLSNKKIDSIVKRNLKYLDHINKEKEQKLPKGKMITGNDGVSYYQRDNKYFRNTGWLEREISKDEFEKGVVKAQKDIDDSLTESKLYKDVVIEYNEPYNYYILRNNDGGSVVGYIPGFKVSNYKELYKIIDDKTYETTDDYIKNESLKEVYDTEKRLKDLKRLQKRRALTDDELEELAYCENEVSSREAEKRYLNNESLKEDVEEETKALRKAYDMLSKDEKAYACIYGYIQGKDLKYLAKPLLKNSPKAVEDFVYSFSRGKEGMKINAKVLYRSQLEKAKRSLGLDK